MRTSSFHLLIPKQLKYIRTFHVGSALQKVRIYDSVRNQNDFHSALRLSIQANTPLITIWTASYCLSCRTIRPRLLELLENRDDMDPDIQYVEVELDSQGGRMGELGSRYMINSLPTLLPFRRGEPVHEKRMTDVRAMSDRNRLKEWIEETAE
ncbi:hypothetical protein BDD12DRAFT_811385 [Trichophaea hybrida]|nr:hypothetical protein BDD12DRAFT_811385 [Trichophaea hybrida]